MFRKLITIKAKSLFTYLLERRGYVGRLSFSHKREEIRITVNPRGEGEGEKSTKDPKNLSGGEKSFTQICLLLSAWEAMGSPIRCLDELYVTAHVPLTVVTFSWMLSIGKPVCR
jgi:structural maintenance of chromosomes protein 6